MERIKKELWHLLLKESSLQYVFAEYKTQLHFGKHVAFWQKLTLLIRLYFALGLRRRTPEEWYFAKRKRRRFPEWENRYMLSGQRWYFPPLLHGQAMADYHSVIRCRLGRREAVPSFFFGIGFQYGGLLCIGFCQWLHCLKQYTGARRLLFCTRDGVILQQIYEMMYPGEDTALLRVSRRSCAEVFFADDPEEALNRRLDGHQALLGKKVTVGQMLADMELEAYQDTWCNVFGLRPEEYLTPESVRRMTQMIARHPDIAKEVYAAYRRAGLAYLRRAAGSGERVIVADIGWHGSMTELLRRLPGTSQLCGAMLGAAGTEQTDRMREQGILYTWLFADDKRRPDVFGSIPLTMPQVGALELLLSSPSPSLKHYGNQDGKTCFITGKANPHRRAVQMMHEGMRAFAREYLPLWKKGGYLLLPELVWPVCAEFILQPKLFSRFCREVSLWKEGKDC